MGRLFVKMVLTSSTFFRFCSRAETEVPSSPAETELWERIQISTSTSKKGAFDALERSLEMLRYRFRSQRLPLTKNMSAKTFHEGPEH